MITPLYKITYKYNNQNRVIFVKDESKNLTGSIKIRPASNIIKRSYELGLLKKDMPVIEVTSGNMGIGLAEALKPYDNKLIIYMPKFMSEERKEKLRKMGAELVLTDTFDEAFKLAEQRKDCFYVRQFENKFNPESYKPLVDEVETKIHEFPLFVAGVGTGGTLNGVGHILKKKYNTKVVAIDPKESMLLMTGKNHGHHEIQGLSDGFIPSLYPKDIVDEIVPISSTDAIRMAQKIKEQLHVGVGISSGAYLLGAILSNTDKTFTVFPDSEDRYYSTRLFSKDVSSEVVDKIELLSLEVL